jgi:chloride channel 7
MDVKEEREGDLHDIESDTMHAPLLRRRNTLSASHLAMVGAKVSHIESLDYE